jgi:hypothetical protein
MLKATGIVFKNQSFMSNAALGSCKSSIVLAFGNVDADSQILVRSTNLFSELTKTLNPAKVLLFHNNLLLAVGLYLADSMLSGGYFFTRRQLLFFLLLLEVYSLIISIYNVRAEIA